MKITLLGNRTLPKIRAKRAYRTGRPTTQSELGIISWPTKAIFKVIKDLKALWRANNPPKTTSFRQHQTWL